MKRGFSSIIKRIVYERDSYKCKYCGKDLSAPYQLWKEKKIDRKEAEITVDHVIPKSKGGAFQPENLVVACKPCNLKKGNKMI